MSLFDAGSRDQLRQAYADAWRKKQAREVMSPIESSIAAVIEAHPEYQTLVSDAAAAKAFEPTGGGAAANPFLHMGLHLAVRDQVAVDRPPGIRELQGRLAAREGDTHRAEHVLMEALGETLVDAQRSGRAPDEALYMERGRRRLSLVKR